MLCFYGYGLFTRSVPSSAHKIEEARNAYRLIYVMGKLGHGGSQRKELTTHLPLLLCGEIIHTNITSRILLLPFI